MSDSLKLMKIMKNTMCFEDGYKMTLEEIDLAYEFRYEIRRLFPVMFFGMLPFGNAIVVPLV